MIRHKSLLPFSLIVMHIIIINLISCGAELGQVVISKPDEYRRTYEANEKIILKAIARVFKDKVIGSNIRINKEKHMVETDYIMQDNWRTKSNAQVKRLNWKESEVILTVITEKQSESGWEMRRLLDKEQYINFFDAIDLKIYEEMSRIE
jgi:bifunctional DNA-binding transcriptional regulator/antitoxin component of YhaV-PrlF toxin-antitoxin module